MKEVMCFPNPNKIITQKTKPEKIVCMCCGESFTVEPFIKQPLCNKCYPVAVKMLFSGMYDDLTVEEFNLAVRKEVMEAGNETGK